MRKIWIGLGALILLGCASPPEFQGSREDTSAPIKVEIEKEEIDFAEVGYRWAALDKTLQGYHHRQADSFVFRDMEQCIEIRGQLAESFILSAEAPTPQESCKAQKDKTPTLAQRELEERLYWEAIFPGWFAWKETQKKCIGVDTDYCSTENIQEFERLLKRPEIPQLPQYETLQQSLLFSVSMLHKDQHAWNIGGHSSTDQLVLEKAFERVNLSSRALLEARSSHTAP